MPSISHQDSEDEGCIRLHRPGRQIRRAESTVIATKYLCRLNISSKPLRHLAALKKLLASPNAVEVHEKLERDGQLRTTITAKPIGNLAPATRMRLRRSGR